MRPEHVSKAATNVPASQTLDPRNAEAVAAIDFPPDHGIQETSDRTDACAIRPRSGT
jgi:hypothetical protein